MEHFTRSESPLGVEDDTFDLEDHLLQSVGFELVRDTVKSLESEGEQTPTSPGSAYPFHARRAPPPLSTHLQNRLVKVYFDTVHNICPAVDQSQFYTWYNQRTRGASTPPLRQLLYQSMLFAAFQYLSDWEVLQTPFATVMDGQKALFDWVHSLFRSLEVGHKGSVELVQSALLLSFWSPYDSTREVNSFWADKAFEHALAGGFQAGAQPYHRVLWWCCLARNRSISLGLWSSHKLRPFDSGPMLQIADFQTTDAAPRWESNATLLRPIETFIHFCRLSVIMNGIALSKHAGVRWDSWKTSETTQGHVTVENIQTIDQSLDRAMVDFEITAAKYEGADPPRQYRALVRLIRIISISTKAFLYEKVLKTPLTDDPMTWLLNTVAVSKIKEASFAVAVQAGRLLAESRIEDVPLTLGAYISFPLAVYWVWVHCQTPMQAGQDLTQFDNLKFLLRAMKTRFSGIQHLAGLVDNIGKEIASIKEQLAEPNSATLEMKLLIHVSRMIHSGLGLGVAVES